MIEKKEIFLRVVENGQIVSKPLFKVDLTEKLQHEMNKATYQAHKEILDKHFNQEYFTEGYLWVFGRIEQLFKDVAKDIDLHEKIAEFGVIYADEPSFPPKEDFKKDKEDGEIKINPLFYFNEERGVVISLERNNWRYSSYYAMAHECGGHYMDFLLNQENYRKRTATMLEVMALLAEKRLGCQLHCTYSLHLRAQRLLQSVFETSFSKMSFKDQWELMNGLYDHKKAQEYFKENLAEKPLIIF